MSPRGETSREAVEAADAFLRKAKYESCPCDEPGEWRDDLATALDAFRARPPEGEEIRAACLQAAEVCYELGKETMLDAIRNVCVVPSNSAHESGPSTKAPETTGPSRNACVPPPADGPTTPRVEPVNKGAYLSLCDVHKDCEIVPGPFCSYCSMNAVFQDGVKAGRESAPFLKAARVEPAGGKCPKCGSDDPAVQRGVVGRYWNTVTMAYDMELCRDPFHAPRVEPRGEPVAWDIIGCDGKPRVFAGVEQSPTRERARAEASVKWLNESDYAAVKWRPYRVVPLYLKAGE